MKKLVLALATVGFSAAVLCAPVLAASHAKKKKAAPGMCGTMMYFDKKTKTCKSKG